MLQGLCQQALQLPAHRALLLPLLGHLNPALATHEVAPGTGEHLTVSGNQ